MQKFISNHRNITIFASYLLLTVIVFVIGYNTGERNEQKSLLKEASYNLESVPNESILPDASNQTSYRVILEDGELRLYLDTNAVSRLISREEISESSFPVSDIASLKKGFVFDTSEEAVVLMENFIS